MFYATIGNYTVLMTTDREDVELYLKSNAGHIEHFPDAEIRDGYLAVNVYDCEKSINLLIEGNFAPGPQSGYHPGVLLIPETKVFFFGAGTQILCFSLDPIQRLALVQTECGFWCWYRHGDFVVMCAELELSVWNIRGERLWSCFVEPPWHYEIEGDILKIDVMDVIKRVALESGECFGT